MDDNERHAQIKRTFGEGAANYASAYHSQMGHFPTDKVLTEGGFEGGTVDKTKGLIRLEARKRARTLVSLLEAELDAMTRRLEKAKATAAYLATDAVALTCPLPNADFTNRLATETARLDALIQLEAELEIEGDK